MFNYRKAAATATGNESPYQLQGLVACHQIYLIVPQINQGVSGQALARASVLRLVFPFWGVN
jgi:hypothetical protein